MYHVIRRHLKSTILLLVLSISPFCKAQQWQWVQSSVSVSNPEDLGGFTTDPFGNIYIVGKQFIAKYNSSGLMLNIDTPLNTPMAIISDANGNIYTTGEKLSLTKYDIAGNILWQKNNTASGRSLTLDATGNIYITGFFSGTQLFDSITLTTTDDAGFIAKYNNNGLCIWATKFEGDIWPDKLPVTIDADGNSYITGGFLRQMQFDTIQLPALGYNGIFIAKYNSTGSCVWAKRAGKTGGRPANFPNMGYAIVAAPNGNIYVTGNMNDTSHFESTQFICRASDVFVAKYNTNGTLLWVNQYGSSSDDIGHSIILDEHENCYVGGNFVWPILFGSGYLISRGNFDLFVVKLDSNGNIIWAKGAGGKAWNEVAEHLAFSGNELLVAGTYTDTTFFDNIMLTNNGSQNAFIAKLSNLTSLNETNFDETSFSIFPNPATNAVTINFTATTPQTTTFRITDMQGRQHYCESLISLSGDNSKTIPLQNLTPGLYLLTIQNSDTNYTTKLIIQ